VLRTSLAQRTPDELRSTYLVNSLRETVSSAPALSTHRAIIMVHVIHPRKTNRCRAQLTLAALLLVAGAPTVQAQRPAARRPAPAPATTRPATATAPTATYWVYVGAESADQIHRVRFGPGGAVLEKTIRIGELAAEMEGPHGLQISPDGKWLYMTTGHGTPDGKLWKYDLGPDTLVAAGISLGKFPASLDVTPDGLYSFSANFNLHGEMVPSSISVVYTPTMTEVAQIETCTMPHGSRIEPSGAMHYSGCMMDDQLVEIDTRSFAVTRRFSLAKGKEGPISGTMAMAGHEMHNMPASGTKSDSAPAAAHQMDMTQGHGMSMNATCSPTWAQPSADGRMVYVACNKADVIIEVDRANWSIARRIATGRGPYNLAVTADGRHMVATLKQSTGVEIYDLTTGLSVAKLPTSTTVAHGVAVSPDSRYAFVSSEGVGAQPGKVDVYDIRARTKVATVDVAQQASGITFWKMEGK
jgi:DNA-binding beta-propeller fold protein YncE